VPVVRTASFTRIGNSSRITLGSGKGEGVSA
jgi:hypothetical protein